MEESPTELFPTCISNYIRLHEEDAVLIALVDYLAPLVIASSGVIVVTPDTLGYGESYNYNRTSLTNIPSTQAWTVSYLSAQQYIRNVTGRCTELAQTTAVGGYGHGGYAAVLAARSLENLGLRVFQLYVGGAVLNLQTQMGFLLQQLGADATSTTMITEEENEFPVSSHYYLESMALLWAFSYSQDVPFINPPYLSSSSWRARILQLSAPNPSVPVLSKNTLLDMINPDIIDFFEVRTIDPMILEETMYK